jgi:glucose-6-phosphate isomerase, archaeal
MRIREPISCRVALDSGTLNGASGRYTKTFGDLAGLYEDDTAFEVAREALGDAVVYEVTDCRPSNAAGDMIFGVTRMMPGKVGREYFMTRGHIHGNPDRPEVYYGQAGNGVMLMESPTGETRVVDIGPQTICYVPPYWIHRSVNTGDRDFVMMFAYPADSGQDYDIIARSNGMRSRIVDDGSGSWTVIENTQYSLRSEEEITRIFTPPN